MPLPYVEDVFTTSGTPTFTYVKPKHHSELLVAVRTPGRGVVVEGPSGVGKTTAILKILEELGRGSEALILSARRPDEREAIQRVMAGEFTGIRLVDDFHLLPVEMREHFANLLKVLADRRSPDRKLILAGINEVGQSLVTIARDVATRIDVIRFEANPLELITELLTKGEQALNVTLTAKANLAAGASGSFYLAQALGWAACMEADVMERSESPKTVEASYAVIVESVLRRLKGKYDGPMLTFVRGSKLRAEGRAPYLHILKWLAESATMSLNLNHSALRYPEHRASVTQLMEKSFLHKHLTTHASELADLIHYDLASRILSIEDPAFHFYIRNQSWKAVAQRAGYRRSIIRGGYDYALSFAGSERPIAERLAEKLQEREISVFYDRNEQHLIVGRDVADYLAPVYRSEAASIIVILSRTYPTRIWTTFESKEFKDRFGDGAVIPVVTSDYAPDPFSPAFSKGRLDLDLTLELEPQLDRIADILAQRLIENAVEETGDPS